MGIPSPFVFYALVDIVIRFFDTVWPVYTNTFVRDRSLTEENRYRDYHTLFLKKKFENFYNDSEKISVRITGLKNPIGNSLNCLLWEPSEARPDMTFIAIFRYCFSHAMNQFINEPHDTETSTFLLCSLSLCTLGLIRHLLFDCWRQCL